MEDTFFLALLIFAAGLLYSSVGHAGASGYLAVMALFGLAPDVMKPTALVLNILVAIIATWHFFRAGYFSWNIFWPFAMSSIPFAFIGGALSLPGSVYKQVLGLICGIPAFSIQALGSYRFGKTSSGSQGYAFRSGDWTIIRGNRCGGRYIFKSFATVYGLGKN